MGREVQGKCRPCRVRYVWAGLPSFRSAHCRRCGRQLKRTSYQSLLRLMVGVPYEQGEFERLRRLVG